MKFASRNTLPVSLSPRSSAKAVRLRRPLAPAAAAACAHRLPSPGKSFGRKRIEHAVEVAGAGIMLAMFLFLALLA